jgi:hypothetical protein
MLVRGPWKECIVHKEAILRCVLGHGGRLHGQGRDEDVGVGVALGEGAERNAGVHDTIRGPGDGLVGKGDVLAPKGAWSVSGSAWQRCL